MWQGVCNRAETPCVSHPREREDTVGLFKTGLYQAARPGVRELPKSTPPKPPALAPPPARLANLYTQDTFTAEQPRRFRQGESAPDSYSSPISASRAGQSSGAGTGVLTLNLANGVDDDDGHTYRSGADRERQASLIRDTGASIVAFQEADVNVERSGHVNTPLDVARRANGAFDVFSDSSQKVPEVGINEPAPPTAIRKGADGTRLYQTPDATLITGESFSGGDRGDAGVDGDTDAGATYGNAIYVAKPSRVVDAYTVALPHSAGPEHPPASDALLEQFARGPATYAQRAELGRVNEGVRDNAAGEPRSALVARVAGPDGRERTIINVHLSRNGNADARNRELDYITKIVEAERSADPSREIVVMGDFNSSTAEVGRAFEQAGLHREVGGQKANGNNYDQVWVSNNAQTTSSAQVDTDGASDHQYAGYTVLE